MMIEWGAGRGRRLGLILTATIALAIAAAVAGWLAMALTDPVQAQESASFESEAGSAVSEPPARLAADATAADATADDDIVVSESVAAFIDKGKPIGHVILALLVIAIFLVVDQLRVHLLEKVRARELLKADARAMDRQSFEELARRAGESRIGRVLVEAEGLYRQSGDLSLLSTEAEVYREREEHRFNTFESRMAFLADTAGGLGLLGTVWGIYRGFAAKAVAQTNEELLAAMSVALVTTFLGIVVSVIINWMSTETGASVRGRIMNAIARVDDYRELLVRDLGGRAA
jgi:biopolymer transport protein ExbB/TolQ